MRLLSSSYSGKANSFTQILCRANLEGFSYIIYASGNCIVVYTDQFEYIQTIQTNEEKQEISVLAVDPTSGQIGVCYGNTVAIYSYSVAPNTMNLQWRLLCEKTFDTEVTCLCWGPEGSLFTSTDFIVQWKFSGEEWSSIWSQRISSQVYMLKLSKDQKYLASVGLNDRLVKVWELEQSQPVFTYLPHPRGVINMDWRQSLSSSTLTVFTMCADGVCRVWAQSIKAGIKSFNVVVAIDPGQFQFNAGSNPNRDLFKSYHIPIHWVCEHVAEHLNTDVFFQAQLDGSLVFWKVNGLDTYPHDYPTVSCLAKIPCSLSSSGFNSFNESVLTTIKYPEHKGTLRKTEIAFLTQHPQGFIDYYTLDYASVISGMDTPTLFLKRTLSGPRGTVSSIIGSLYDNNITTFSDDGEIGVWEASSPRFGKSHKDPMTEVNSHFVGSNITIAQRLPQGNLILLYDGENIGVHSYQRNEGWKCLLHLDNYDPVYPLTHIDIIFKSDQNAEQYHVYGFSTNQNTVFVWSIHLSGSRIVAKFCSRNALETQDNVSNIGKRCQADIHSVAYISGDQDQVDLVTFSQHTKILRFWAAKIPAEPESLITWDEVVNYRFNEAVQYIRWSPFGKIVTALYRENALYINFYGVSMHSTNILDEFEVSISENNELVALELNATSIGEHMLALVFKDRITFIGQQRADEISKSSVWREYGTMSILELSSREITGADWTKEGLVVATGNQLWYLSKWIIPQKDTSNNLGPSLNHSLAIGKAPLPHHHPNHLTQYMLWGKVNIVKYILTQLYNYLEAYSKSSNTTAEVPPVPMKFFIHNKMPVFAQEKYNQLFDDYEDKDTWRQKQAESKEFNQVQAEALVEHLTKKSLNGISNLEQMHLMGIVDGVSKIEEQARALDENGSRFLLSLKLNTFMKCMKSHMKPGSGKLSYRDMMWALHSESQDLLIEFCTESCDGKLLWSDARSYGFSLWINSEETFKRQIELIGKSHYMSKEEKDPVDSTIYYLALRKVKLLHNLWKNVGYHKEKTAMVSFLANDFSEARWQQAALKNAFVLLGKQRYEYAAAFFLLGDRLKDAVRVCLNYLKDFQLAIAICRCYEGDDSPTLKELLRDHVLVKGFDKGNRWLVALGFWLLGEREKSFKALMMPLSQLTEGLELNQKPAETRIDPASLVLLQSFKDKSYKFRWDQLCLTSEQETNYIWEVVSVYQDLGCPLLALEITQTWEFGILSKPSASKFGKNVTQDPGHTSAHSINTGVVSFDDWGWDQPASQPKAVTAENLFDDYSPPKITADNLFDDYTPAVTADNLFDDYTPAITADNLFDDYKPSISVDDLDEPESTPQSSTHIINSNNQVEWIIYCRKNIVLQAIPYLLDGLSAATVRGSCMQKSSFFQGYLDQIREGLHSICEESGIAPGILDNILISRCIETDSVSVCFELLFQGVLVNPTENSRFIQMLTESFNSLIQYVFATSSHTQADHSYQIQWARELFKSSAQWFVFLQDKMSNSIAKVYIQKLSLTAFTALLLGNLADAKYDRALLCVFRAERFLCHLTDDIFELQLVIKDVVNGVLPGADQDTTSNSEELCMDDYDVDDTEYESHVSAEKQVQVHRVIYEHSIKFLIHYMEEMIRSLETRNDDEFKSFATVGILEPLINLYKRMIRLRGHDSDVLDVTKYLQTREQRLVWHILSKPFKEVEADSPPPISSNPEM
ncbi:regulator of (H+)-ATPase in vacuolar membrane [Basidiobolus ranarum]|uniref:Regulator of (H+)-ATPase in vacuolar membrane n=1 Tax=Basidiobolus ranarum TaxID=34480 RepID=A0ABR2WR32_9FUNG